MQDGRAAGQWAGDEQPDHAHQEVRLLLLFNSDAAYPPISPVMSGGGLHFANTASTTVPNTQDGSPLTSLIRRLEAATSRLEDIAQSASNGESPADQQHDSISAASGAPASNSMPELTGASKGGSREDSTTSTVQPVKLPPSIEEMDDLIKGEVADFQEASKGLDPLIEEQVCISMCTSFQIRLGILIMGARHHRLRKPLQTSGASF